MNTYYALLLLVSLTGVFAQNAPVPKVCDRPVQSGVKGEELVTLLANCFVHFIVAEISPAKIPYSSVAEDYCNFFNILNRTRYDGGNTLLECLVRGFLIEDDALKMREKIKGNAGHIFPFPSYDFDDCHARMHGAGVKEILGYFSSDDVQMTLCLLLDLVHKMSNAKDLTEEDSSQSNFHEHGDSTD